MKLKKGLYGLKQGARCFYEKFRADLLSWGFKSGEADPCLYMKSDGEDQIRVLVGSSFWVASSCRLISILVEVGRVPTDDQVSGLYQADA